MTANAYAPLATLPPMASAANTSAPRRSAKDGIHQRLRQKGRDGLRTGGRLRAPGSVTGRIIRLYVMSSAWKTSSTVVSK